MATSRRDKLSPDLSAYLDGELSAERAREIERLLAESPECRAEFEQLRESSDQVAALPRRRAPDQLAAAMRSCAERRQLLDEKPAAGRARRLRLIAGVTAAAAVLVGGVLVGRHVFSPDRPPPVGYPVVDPSLTARPAEQKETRAVAGRGPKGATRRAEDGLAASVEVAAAESAADADAAPAVIGREPVLAAVEPSPLGEPVVAFGLDFKKTAGPDVSRIPLDVADTVRPESTTELYVYDRAGPTVAYAGDPSVDVLITPQSVKQYRATLAVLGLPGGRSEGGPRASRARHSGVAEPQPPRLRGVRFVQRVPAAEVTTLIADLEQRAPQQVQVTMTLKGSHVDLLRKLGRALPEKDVGHTAARDEITTGEPPEAVDARAKKTAVGRLAAAGGRGAAGGAQVSRTPGSGGSPLVRGADEARENLGYGGGGLRPGRAGGPEAAAARSAARPQAADPVTPALPAEREPALPGTQPAKRIRPLESLGESGAESSAAPSRVAGKRSTGSFGARARAFIKSVVAQLQQAARSLPTARPTPADEAVTVRVTLLPPLVVPPSRLTTQPTPLPTKQP